MHNLIFLHGIILPLPGNNGIEAHKGLLITREKIRMSINFSAKKKKGRGSANRAFLAAIALCCAAVGLVAWSSALGRNSRNAASKADLPGELPGELPTEAVFEPDPEPDLSPIYPDMPVDNEPVIVAEPDSAVLTEPMPDAAVSVSAEPDISYSDAAPASYILPVSGGIMCGFSGSNLVYSKTMCDWRVHQGIDIECSPGTSVTSCGNGMVYDVVDDPLYGTTVIVDSDDGSSLYYCGLEQTSVSVKKGTMLKSGDVIGMVGVVPCESADGTHIHLALMKNGGYADPMALIS